MLKSNKILLNFMINSSPLKNSKINSKNLSKRNIIFLFIILSNLFIYTACVTDYDLFDVSTDVKIDESLVFPVGEVTISVEDVLNKYGLPKNIDTTNSVISYIETFDFQYKYKGLDLTKNIKPFRKYFYLSPISVVHPPNSPIDLPLFDAAIEMGINQDISKERVDSVTMNSAKMKIILEVSDDLLFLSPSDVSVDFLFPEDTLAFNDHTIPSFQPLAYGEPGYLPVGKFSILLNGSSLIPLKIRVNIKNQASAINLDENSYVLLRMEFVDTDLSCIYGMFDINESDDYRYNFAEEMKKYIPNGLIQIAKPKVDVTLTSNVGMDFKLNIDQLKAYHSSNPNKEFEAVFIDPKTGAKGLTYTDFYYGPMLYGNLVPKEIPPFNNVNGEFDKLFDNYPYPNTVKYKASLSNIKSRAYNFISKDNKVDVKIRTTLPFEMKRNSYLTIKDTIRNVDIGVELDKLDSAVLVLKLKNGFPLQAKYRMTFWRSNLPNDTIPAFGGEINTVQNNTQQGNLTSAYIVNSARIDESGLVTKIEAQDVLIALNKQQLEAFKETNFIVFSVLLTNDDDSENPLNQHPVSLTTRNNFAVKLGLFVKTNSTISLFKNAN